MSDELEEIATSTVEGNFYGNKEVRHIVWRTIKQLPLEIARWIHGKNIFFFASGDQLGEYLPLKGPIDHLFFLSGNLMERDEEEASFVIAHEIAHAMLHQKGGLPSGGEACEKACDEMASEWGFQNPDS